MPKEFLEDAFAAGHNGWCEELSRTLPARRFELAWLWQLNGFLTRPGVSTHTHTCHDLKMIQIIQAVPTQHKHFCIHYTKKTWQQWPVESSNKSQVFSSYGPRVFIPRDPWSCRSYFYLVWRIVGESGTFVQPTPRWLVSGQKSIGCLCSTKMQTPTVPQFSAFTLGRQPSPTSGCRIVFFYLLMEPPGK